MTPAKRLEQVRALISHLLGVWGVWRLESGNDAVYYVAIDRFSTLTRDEVAKHLDPLPIKYRLMPMHGEFVTGGTK